MRMPKKKGDDQAEDAGIQRLNKLLQDTYRALKKDVAKPIQQDSAYAQSSTANPQPGGSAMPAGAVGPAFARDLEPLVDMIDRKGEIVIMVEMQGVHGRDLSVSASHTGVDIFGRGSFRNYTKKVDFPSQVTPTPKEAKFRNGILELTFEKSQKQGGRVNVKVEY